MSQLANISRRSIFASCLGWTAGSLFQSAASKEGSILSTPPTISDERPQPIEFENGLVISDVRIIPGVIPERFLIEIQNHREDAIDTPAIGAVIPDAPDPQSFLLADPWHPVLQPGTSTFGFGLLPTGFTSLQEIDWIPCKLDVEAGPYTQVLLGWDVMFDYSVKVWTDRNLEISYRITNTGEARIRHLQLRGMVRDPNGRLCGGIPVPNIYNLSPGMVFERRVSLVDHWSAMANPYPLCNDANDMDVFMEIQPVGTGVRQACPPVMPWNR